MELSSPDGSREEGLAGRRFVDEPSREKWKKGEAGREEEPGALESGRRERSGERGEARREGREEINADLEREDARGAWVVRGMRRRNGETGTVTMDIWELQ